MKRILSGIFVFLLALSLSACSYLAGPPALPPQEGEQGQGQVQVVEGEAYTEPEQVAGYLHLFQELPPNYLSKQEAIALGWDAAQGNLWEVTDKMSIGGDKFGNREGLLPKAPDRQYYECDVNYEGGHRGAERIVYSNDGLIYYTDDHYASFVLLYGEE